MARGPKVTVKLPTIKGIAKGDIINRRFQKKLGEAVLKDVLDAVEVGKSPVKGAGRYAGYKVDRASASARKSRSSKSKKKIESANANSRFYPNSVKDKYPSKQKRPVNLELSGKFLSKFDWKRMKNGVKIGLMSRNKKLRQMFETHNDGTHKHVPRRPIIPTGPGEKFTANIMRNIKDLFLERINEMIRKKRR